jgi:hypothetical protein
VLPVRRGLSFYPRKGNPFADNSPSFGRDAPAGAIKGDADAKHTREHRPMTRKLRVYKYSSGKEKLVTRVRPDRKIGADPGKFPKLNKATPRPTKGKNSKDDGKKK